MSGDVQPRKRKDRKRKKDELGLEEPRGTAAVLGEGDVFMHSQHEHGTGGHWCAKIIFFSLLAILITLIGLIILENRGLTELEANAVESRYSGVLQGWIEDSPADNHHDEHTLDIKHHDDDEIDQNENDQSNELDHDTEDNSDEVDYHSNENEDHGEESNLKEDDDDNQLDVENDDEGHEPNENDDDSQEDSEEDDEHDDSEASDENNALDGFDDNGNLIDEDSMEDVDNYIKTEEHVEENDEDELGKFYSKKYFESNEYNEDDETDTIRKVNNNEEENDNQSEETEEFENYNIDNSRKETNGEDLGHTEQYEKEDDNHKNVIGQIRRNTENVEDFAMGEEDSDVEVEKIEKEYSDEELNEPLTDVPVATIKKDLKEQEKSNENISEEDEDDEEFLSPEDIEELPIVEPITAPRGKPLIELEDETSTEKPPNTLAEEEEYEKQQEELSRQKELQASHMWLKVVVGCALLVATHAVVRRATAPRDINIVSNEGYDVREETPTLIDRRMTLLLEESIPVSSKVIEEMSQSLTPDLEETFAFTSNPSPVLKQNIKKIEEKIPPVVEEFTSIKTIRDEEEEKELYSDEDDEDVQEEVLEEKTELPKQYVTEGKPDLSPESDPEEVSDDVEIIDDEQLEEEIIDEDEEEISDVDDSELLSRLEAKYGRLPEPDRPGSKHKDGGNNIADEWPGEPSERYWRQYLGQAEQDLQEDWRH